jgi:hypothetical protein
MDGWNFSPAVSSRMVRRISINLGPGWTNLTPGLPPADCNETPADGQWIW